MTALTVAPATLGSSTKARFASFVMLIAGILAIGMVGLLVFTTALQEQTFVVNAKRTEATVLENKLWDLEAQLAAANSMTSLAARAQDLGMKPNPYPAQLQLPTGKVIGKPRPVYGSEVPGARYRTQEEQEAYREKVEEEARAKKEAAAAKKKAAAEAKKKAAAEKKAAEKAEKERLAGGGH